MKKQKKAAVILSAVALSTVLAAGCAGRSEKIAVPFVSGGSKADGAVNIVYNIIDGGVFAPKYNAPSETVMLALAADRCKKWGYKGAEPFGGHTHKCTAYYTSTICVNYEFTVAFACTE